MATQTVEPEVRHYLLTSLLKEVSRSFYLTLRVLPGAIRSQIGLAYLLARISDTIADTEVLPVPMRLAALRNFGDAVRNPGATLLLSKFPENQGNQSERVLIQRAPEAITLLDSLNPEDSQRIRRLMETIVSGQSLDLERFSRSDPNEIKSLHEDVELDDYTYRVAGCVGEFWTLMCLAHLSGSVSDPDQLIRNGIRFGKGLQLVNILRDLPTDLRNGRSYIPDSALGRYDLTPVDLLDRNQEHKFRPLYNLYLDQARDHLHSGWNYTIALPKQWRRVRLACSWPILIGLATLQKLRHESILDSSRRIKVSRSGIRSILFRSIALYPFQKKWAGMVET